MSDLWNLPRWNKPTQLEVQIEMVLKKMQGVGVDHDEYPKYIRYLEQLHDIEKEEKRDRVSHDTLAIVIGNLVGIFIIVAYEQRHVITTRGFTQLIRPRPPGT